MNKIDKKIVEYYNRAVKILNKVEPRGDDIYVLADIINIAKMIQLEEINPEQKNEYTISNDAKPMFCHKVDGIVAGVHRAHDPLRGQLRLWRTTIKERLSLSLLLLKQVRESLYQ